MNLSEEKRGHLLYLLRGRGNLSNREIARLVGVNESTVRRYKKQVFSTGEDTPSTVDELQAQRYKEGYEELGEMFVPQGETVEYTAHCEAKGD